MLTALTPRVAAETIFLVRLNYTSLLLT